MFSSGICKILPAESINGPADTVDLALLFAYAKNDFLSNLISVANFLSKSLRAFLISVEANLLAFTHAGWSYVFIFYKRSVLLMCSSVLGTKVAQSDPSSVTSVLGQFGPQKRAEVTEDQNDQGPKWMYTLESLHLSVNL